MRVTVVTLAEHLQALLSDRSLVDDFSERGARGGEIRRTSCRSEELGVEVLAEQLKKLLAISELLHLGVAKLTVGLHAVNFVRSGIAGRFELVDVQLRLLLGALDVLDVREHEGVHVLALENLSARAVDLRERGVAGLGEDWDDLFVTCTIPVVGGRPVREVNEARIFLLQGDCVVADTALEQLLLFVQQDQTLVRHQEADDARVQLEVIQVHVRRLGSVREVQLVLAERIVSELHSGHVVGDFFVHLELLADGEEEHGGLHGVAFQVGVVVVDVHAAVHLEVELAEHPGAADHVALKDAVPLEGEQ